MSVVDAIERAVREHPDRGAVETPEGVITYRDFGERVRDLAARIESRTAPGEFVGIEAGRTPAAIVAMVAALRTRRPFVVIDPRDSASSNRAKVASLGVGVVSRSTGPSAAAELVRTPAEWRDEAGTRPSSGPVPPREGIGYAIHTSGSTGEPKCVLVRARPLARMVGDHVRRLELGPESRTLQFARLTFDGCVTEILWTLTSGACLVVVDETLLAPGPVLRSTLEKFRITHLKTTPFALTATEPTGAMSLEHVINGGGACRHAVVRTWSRAANFHNAYGTTETTVCNLLTDALAPEDCGDAVPLGEIVGDCGYDIAPLPGESDGDTGGGATRGELVITGDSVAVGYLTAEGVRPFVDDDGNRAYRTGDIVELRDGRLYFVERLDRQLKVRGYRIDPGEVESAACRLDSVKEAVVTAEAHTDVEGAGADALVCYYQGDADPREMRGHLEAVLDSYKVPSVLRRVESMPYTPNGKVDRDALRESRRPEPAGDDAATPQQRVLGLVRHLTGVGDAGLEDNFFDIGGDSASTVLLVNKLKELGWMDAGVRDVLRAENLRELTDRLPERSG
ncbi:non-ribosomal peptide synthetase [Nocardiopsis sp. FIRDI 009]|uniref:non-ribosomal peptide synthetase n=1 Tax=Nocardiopsis sp. FIRDI 009 TaxID=714197 RepID=UPI000E23A0AC|nr:non-ribosomal peptide synthetase [Nocardiopsis sp. FIRDI 009]